jgi:hypothetical protein
MKKILVWHQKVDNDNSIFSGAIIVEKSEYDFWLELLKKQDTPFEVNLTSHEEDTIEFEDGQELLDNVEVSDLSETDEIIMKRYIGEGIGILNFYTDVVSDLDNSDFFIDMSDSVEEEVEEDK